MRDKKKLLIPDGRNCFYNYLLHKPTMLNRSTENSKLKLLIYYAFTYPVSIQFLHQFSSDHAELPI